MIIKDLTNPVIGKLRQRTEMAPYVPYYVAMSIIDLTQNYEFEELKTTGPLSNFVENIAEYPIVGYDPNGITGNPFINAEDTKLTFINNWFVYFDTSGVITPGQSTGKNIDKRDLRVVEPMSKILGIPSVYTIHGAKSNQGKIIVGQMPDNPYACQMRYQRQHPFNVPFAEINQAQGDSVLANKLAMSVIFMPDDWHEIVVLATAEKICDDIGLNEIGQLYHNKLYGYKDKKGNEYPGIISARVNAESRNTLGNSRALRPVVKRYI
jgi:hypothetical protein